MTYYIYGEEEIQYLKKADRVLGREIDNIGIIKRKVNKDIFSALISSIISQQISTKSALTVKSRLIEKVGKISPETIETIDIEEIQSCGMSMRKAGYIKGIAKAALSKTIDFDNLYNLSDEEVKKELIKLKGVGEWTAEMLLINSLERPDILSFKDLGIRRGIMRLYDLEDLTLEEFEVYRERYSPYGSVASLYLWEIASRE